MPQAPKRPDTGAKATGGGGRRRTPPPAVKKPFPWGIVIVSTVLGLLLLGILVYAVTNQGSGFVTALDRADDRTGATVFKDLSSKHVPGPVKYEQLPPVGGEHNTSPQTCQVYAAPIANEHAVHSLEHGAVWVTYRPDLPPGDVGKLVSLVQGDAHRMLSPFPGLDAKISLQAWGRQIKVDSPDDERVETFLDAYTSGPQAPERGAACTGTTAPGPLQAPPPQPLPTATAPAPATGSPMPSPAASPSA